MKKKLYILLLILIPVVLIGADAGNFLQHLYNQLVVYTKNNPQEKIYIQTDKTFFKQSENIWYKIFLLNSNDNQPSQISDVVYVELKDPKGNVIAKHDHNVIEGVSDGQFEIGEDAPGGIYTLVAYTSWMKNFGEEQYFKKEITVQKVVTPRLLLKLDFEKRAYGPGDEVVGLLSVSNLRNEKTEGSTIKSDVRINGVTVQTLNNLTEKGEAKIKFRLPNDLESADGILQILVTDRGLTESITRSIPIVLNKIDIQFLPEGGDLVVNAPGKVAFKAVNEFGKGADVSGKIVDENGNIVTQFESFHLGMGAFALKPEPGKAYFAKIERPLGNSRLIRLPIVKTTGYSLNLKSMNKKTLTWSVYSQEKASVMLVGQTQGTMYIAKQVDLKPGKNDVDVKLDDFPIGVAVFTLFDERYDEQCERLVYLNPEKGLNIKIESDKTIYHPKEEVKLNITTTNKEGKGVPANLALSVVDEQLLALADDKQDNMLSYILFSSELKGKIEEPFFYFDETQPKAKEAIDYLMLTHGWRRFGWDDIFKSQETMQEHAEKLSEVYGYVKDVKGNFKQADVYLIEREKQRRVVKVRTTPEGFFVFRNVDVSANVYITTQTPNYVHIFKHKPQILVSVKNHDIFEGIDMDNLTQENFFIGSPSRVSDIKDISGVEDVSYSEISDLNSKINVMRSVKSTEPLYDMISADMPYLRDESSELSEVVVTGYGRQTSKSLAASASVVTQTAEYMYPIVSVPSAIVGALKGVSTSSDRFNFNPGASYFMSMRGTSSFGDGNINNQIILNGVRLTQSPSQNYSGFDLINQNEISTIEMGKHPLMMYPLDKAVNGNIYITTKTPVFRERYRKGYNYSGITIPKRYFYTPHKFAQNVDNEQQDKTTVYWNANVKTDDTGKATLTFLNNDVSSSFRVTAEGLSAPNGLIGSQIHKISTQKPFSIDVKTPLFASYNDEVSIPVMVKNNTDKAVRAKVNIDLPKDLAASGKQSEKEVSISPQSTQVVNFTFVPANSPGAHNFTISAATDNYSDEINRSVTVRSVYFPESYSFSGRQFDKTENFELGNHINNSVKAELVCYTNFLEELFDGVESIFRQPYGCFEQVSSSTFPNIFALQLMNTTGQGDDATRLRALEYLKSGYEKLAAYEVKGTGGFEWYGGSPAHEVLSAYGLVEFHEMSKVYKNVDKDMMERTRKYILSRRDGKGGFKQNNGRYGFSGAPKEVNNAYIVYALSETGDLESITAEYNAAMAEAGKSKDMYRMALMANAAFNAKKMNEYKELVEKFKLFANNQKSLDDISKSAKASIVYSYDKNLAKETVAFWLIALLKSDSSDMDLIDKCINYISAGRSGGGFGSTQTTSICLQALTMYANIVKNSSLEGVINIYNNDKQVASVDLSEIENENGKITYDMSNFIVKGNNKIRIESSKMEKPYPFSVNINWETATPPSNILCPLLLTAKLNSHNIKRNETVRLSVSLKNKASVGQPMSIAVIGIPGGLSLQPWQLKELQDKNVYDFYEIINDNLVIYYRELGPNEEKIINLDLKAEISGTYKGMASSAYVYYSDVYKHWIDGISVNVTE